MSHTPGPWRISASGKVVWADGIKITQQVGPSAASCAVQAAIEETTKANNRLIAAAPDMLEVMRQLMEFRQWSESDGNYVYWVGETLFYEAERAFLKATGSAAPMSEPREDQSE